MNNKKNNHSNKFKKKVYSGYEDDGFQYCAKRKILSFKKERKIKNEERWEDD